MSDFNEVLDELDVKRLEKAIENYISDLLTTGQQVADAQFAATEVEGNYPVVTHTEVNKLGGKLVAEGDDVIFREFGTGVGAKDSPHEWNAETGYGEDTWSKDHWQMYHKYGFWFHDGKFYRGQAPARAMYDALNEMIKKVEKGDGFEW